MRENTTLPFEEYFWHNVDPDGKVVLDAGTGFGLITLEIAKRISQYERKGKIISVDIDVEAFEQARKLLKAQRLLDLVTFVKADLSFMPEIASESIDLVISTRTLADINSHPCRLNKAIAEFHRILKPNGQAILSDECPRLKPQNQEETVAVARWQLAKAISHLTGKPHANEIKPEDLEFTMKLTGFKNCRWAIFKGNPIPQKRINHFAETATQMTRQISDKGLATAFTKAIENIKKTYKKQGGNFPPRYILHAKKQHHHQETER